MPRANVIEFKLVGSENVSQAFDRAGGAMRRVASVARIAATAVTATAAAITAGVAGAYKFANAHAATEDAVGKFADRLGTTSDVLSRFHAAATLGGTTTRSMDIALQRFNRRIGDSLRGMKEVTKRFEDLNLNAAELAAMPLEERMYAFADALQKVENPAQRLSYAVGLLDTEGAGFLQTIKNGSQSLKDVAADLERLGGVISPQQAANAALYTQEVSRFHMAVSGLGRAIADELIPYLAKLAEMNANFVASGRNLLRGFTKAVIIELSTAYFYIKNILTNLYDIATLSFDWKGFLKDTAQDILDFGQNIFDNVSFYLQKIAAHIHAVITGIARSVASVAQQIAQNLRAIITGQWWDLQPISDLKEQLDLVWKDSLANLKHSLKEIELSFTSAGKSVGKLTLPIARGLKGARKQAEALYESMQKIGTVSTETEGGVVIPPRLTEGENVPVPDKNLQETANQYATFYDALVAQAQSFSDRVGNIYAQLGAETFSFLMRASNAAGQAFASVITGAQSIGDALKNLFKQTLAQGIAMLVQIGMQRLILKAINLATTQTESIVSTIAGLKAVYLNSFASAAAIPIYGWSIAPGVAQANLLQAQATAGAMEVAGAAHGGLDNVPKEATYLLDKGERVLSPEQNKDFTKFIKNITNSSNRIYNTYNSHKERDQSINFTSLHKGVDYVPQETTYLLDKGERVVSSSQNARIIELLEGSTTSNIVINKIEVLPNATNAKALLDMDARDVERVVSDKLYAAFEKLARQGVKMRGVY